MSTTTYFEQLKTSGPAHCPLCGRISPVFVRDLDDLVCPSCAEVHAWLRDQRQRLGGLVQTETPLVP